MHIPDGFIDAATSAGAGAVAAGGRVSRCGGRARCSTSGGSPLAGLVAAFVFAVQMLNFPVASGTSGHLLGGVLAAVLVGPVRRGRCASRSCWSCRRCCSPTGACRRSASTSSTWRSSTAFGGYAVFLLLHADAARGPLGGVVRRLGRRRRRLGGARVGGLQRSSTPSAATGGGPSATVAGAMVGVHVLIGIGEGVITGLAVGAVLAARPDLVWGARDLAPEPVAEPGRPAGGVVRGRGRAAVAFIVVGLRRRAGAGVLREPAGQQRARRPEQGADRQGASPTRRHGHALDDAPTAGYRVEGVDDERLSTGLAGVIGVAVTFAVAGGLILVVDAAPGRSGRAVQHGGRRDGHRPRLDGLIARATRACTGWRPR